MRATNLKGDVPSQSTHKARLFSTSQSLWAPPQIWQRCPLPLVEYYVKNEASERCHVIECMHLSCNCPVGLLKKNEGRNSHIDWWW